MKLHFLRNFLRFQRLRKLVEVCELLEVLRSPQIPEHLRGLFAHFPAGLGQRFAFKRFVSLGGEKLSARNADDPREVPTFLLKCLIVIGQRITASFRKMWTLATADLFGDRSGGRFSASTMLLVRSP
jgi:hypothetical protein